MKTLSGQDVSKFSFGTMQFGGTADEAESAALYNASRDVGINFFDTAYVYTGGKSEEILGSLIAGERDDIFVATKVGYDHAPTMENIKNYADVSRKRLGIDVIDLLYLHRLDNDVPMEIQAEGLASLMMSGTVRTIGVSNFAAWEVMKFRAVCDSFGIEPSFVQPMYSLVKRQAEVEILPMAASEGMHVCPYSPLGGGLLTGKYASGDGGRLLDDDRYKARYAQDWMHQTAVDLTALGAEVGAHPATLAAAWVGRNPAIWGPIISARSVAQLQPSLAAVSFEMDDALYERVASLSPTPAPANDRLEEV